MLALRVDHTGRRAQAAPAYADAPAMILISYNGITFIYTKRTFIEKRMAAQLFLSYHFGIFKYQ